MSSAGAVHGRYKCGSAQNSALSLTDSSMRDSADRSRTRPQDQVDAGAWTEPPIASKSKMPS